MLKQEWSLIRVDGIDKSEDIFDYKILLDVELYWKQPPSIKQEEIMRDIITQKIKIKIFDYLEVNRDRLMYDILTYHK